MNIVWYSEVKWNYLRTRKQNLLTHFPLNDRILFFQPFSFVKSNYFFPRKEGNIYYLTLPTYRKSSYKFIDTLMSFNILSQHLNEQFSFQFVCLEEGRGEGSPCQLCTPVLYELRVKMNATFRG